MAALNIGNTLRRKAGHGEVPTRTVAIIKPHALQSRFDIEPRISQAGFEIVKERQMEFDVETDPQTLFELFGEDAECFAEGPVWVYVLERPRAVKTWLELMGDADPAVALQRDETSLRALYGMTPSQNGLMGSASDEQAEMQIAALFASSPPFPTHDLPLVDGEHSDGQISSGMDSFGLTSNPPLSNASRTSAGGSPATKERRTSGGFKARPVPATTAAPIIEPKMSRAAALRKSLSTGAAELGVPAPKSSPRAPLSRERLAQTFADVPGHGFRSQKIAVASTAPPKVAPRMSRAASLRLGLPVEPVPQKTSPISSKAGSPNEDRKGTFDGVAGHKRRESFTVASTRAPTVAPRLNKAAALRAEKKDAAPPSSFNLRGGAPTLSRRSSVDGGSAGSISAGPVGRRSVDSTARPSVPRTNSRSSVDGGSRPPPVSSTASLSRATSHRAAASIATSKPSVRARPSSSAGTITKPAESEESSAPRAAKAPRPSSIGPPTVAPRQNKAALLRAAKMAGATSAPTKSKARPVSTF